MKLSKRILALLLITLLFVFIPVTSHAANKKFPLKSKESDAYLFINDNSTGKEYNLYRSEYMKTLDPVISAPAGATYNERTNTLTLKNFKKRNAEIVIRSMGSGFKIKLIGKNEVLAIASDANYKYPSSITFTGNGSLVVNRNRGNYSVNIDKNNKYSACIPHAIKITDWNSTSKITISKGCKITAYAGKEAGQDAIYIAESKDSNGGINCKAKITSGEIEKYCVVNYAYNAKTNKKEKVKTYFYAVIGKKFSCK